MIISCNCQLYTMYHQDESLSEGLFRFSWSLGWGGREGYHLDETNWGEKTWSLWESYSLCRGFRGCGKQIQCRHACADLLLCALDCVRNLSNCPTSCSVIPHNDGLQPGTVSQTNLFSRRLLWSEFYHNQKRNQSQWANERKLSKMFHFIDEK